VVLTIKDNGCEFYRPIPEWINYLIELGYTWVDHNDTNKRRITLISMPCKSNAASFLALGVIRKELENEPTCRYNFLVNNIKILQERSEECLLIDKYGKKWKVSSVDPDNSISVADANYRKLVKRKGKFISNPNGILTSVLLKNYMSDWRIDGYAPVITNESIDRHIYDFFPYCTGVLDLTALHTSSDRTLFLSNVAGKSTTKKNELNNLLFAVNDTKISLSDLLTLNDDDCKIKRLNFCSVRNLDSFSYINSPEQVIADGTQAFLSALDKFKYSDIIGVISRDEPIVNLESALNKINELSRYYQVIDKSGYLDSMKSDVFSSITVKFMERR
jgi:hypothetical protein